MSESVLLVEDEPQARQLLHAALTGAGYRVFLAEKLAMGWNLFTAEKPSLVVIDIGLPDGSGLDLCEKIRQHKTHGRTPVIILTAKADTDVKVAGFKAGADQYLIKPLQPAEFLLWVEALLRRVQYDTEVGDELVAGECRIDLKSRLIAFKGQTISYLTNREFDLLYFLVKKRPQVLSRKFLLSQLWHTITVDQVVNTHISNLRRKLPPELADHIQTVPGKGFRFME